MSISAEDWKAIGQEIARQAAANGWTPERWFIERMCWLLDERERPPKKVKYKPEPAQTAFLNEMWFYNALLKARQQGFSSTIALVCLAFAILNLNFRIGIIDRTDTEAQKKLSKIKFAYDHLDDTDDPTTAALGAALKQAIPLVTPTNAHTMTFGNGTVIYAGTSFRGGALNILWISELGTIAMENPGKAQEIMAGSLESVHPGNIIISESTHEGGRFGAHYELIRQGQKSPAHPYITNMQWKFHFHGWHETPRYSVPLYPGQKLALTPDLITYFANVERECGITITDEQKNWYIQKSATQRDMARQYPATPEEALRAQTEGAIYADILSKLRATGRVCDLVRDHSTPLFTSWDLGMTDAVGIWLLQIVGPDIHALDFHCANGDTPGQHAAKMFEWERTWGAPIQAHYVPHDANQKKPGGTWMQLLEEAGLRNIKRVERIPNVWIGINQTRQILPRFRFHARTCEREFEIGGQRVWPSGLSALEGYRKRVEMVQGRESEAPIHDECESGASSLRTFAEAHAKGMLVGPTKQEVTARRLVMSPQRALTGLSREPRKVGAVVLR